MWKQFWTDEAGAIISAELVLLLTILVIGLSVGLASLRDSVATELGDAGQAFSNLDQSFAVTGLTSHSGASAGVTFTDSLDFCDSVGVGNANNGRGIVVAGPPPVLSSGER